MSMDFISQVQEYSKDLQSLEHMLGKGLNIPYNATNSGSRKIMNGTHQSHTLVLTRAEIPFIETGFENRFGDCSSSIIEADDDYQVIAKIPKFSHAPNHHYWMILRSLNSNKLHCIERISYIFRTEVYGYLHNNSMMDAYQPGAVIRKGEVLRRSTGFDKYGNKTNGLNLNTAYMCNDKNMEDSVIISDLCQQKMAAPLIRNVRIILNENDIPLNLYGDDNLYKVCPDVGEEVKDGVLLAYRREKKEEAIYTQSVKMLQQFMMSDEKITINGTVIDFNIYCNNIENLRQNSYNAQFCAYYNDRLRFAQQVMDAVGGYVSNGYEMTYDLEKLFNICNQELNGYKFMDKRSFSNLTLEYVVMENRNLDIGDKVADRYGGKGVVSVVVPYYLMPQLPNGEYLDIIKNNSTMYNRENASQIFELSLNYISMRIIDFIKTGALDAEDSYAMISKFVHLVSPVEAEEMDQMVGKMAREDFAFFLDSIIQAGCIHISNLPITENMTIDKLGAIYEAFPWIKQQNLTVPIEDSNGNIRYIETRRPMIAAKQYVLRLKQFAEEKFSATSLSSTNIKNENAKSKASKNYRQPYSNTPIKFGPMESGDMNHMGSDAVVINLMLHSLSPHGRRLVEQMYLGDPYNVDIKLDHKSKNRSAEILNARLKTMGYRIKFKKTKKKIVNAALVSPVTFVGRPGLMDAVSFVESKDYDYEHWYNTLREIEEIKKKNGVNIDAVSWLE